MLNKIIDIIKDDPLQLSYVIPFITIMCSISLTVMILSLTGVISDDDCVDTVRIVLNNTVSEETVCRHGALATIKVVNDHLVVTCTCPAEP